MCSLASLYRWGNLRQNKNEMFNLPVEGSRWVSCLNLKLTAHTFILYTQLPSLIQTHTLPGSSVAQISLTTTSEVGHQTWPEHLRLHMNRLAWLQLHLKNRLIFNYLYLCMHECMYWHLSADAREGQKKVLDPVNLELQVVVSCLL